MFVDVSKILKIHGASVDIDSKEEISDLENNGQKLNFLEPLSVTGKLTNLGEVFLLECKLSTRLLIPCDRCAEEYSYDLTVEFDEKFTSKDNADDEEIIPFKGFMIDLDDVIKSNILLNLPLKFLCSEDCKGLCPICGTNKNKKQCDCTQDNIDPRMEKLKKLFK